MPNLRRPHRPGFRQLTLAALTTASLLLGSQPARADLDSMLQQLPQGAAGALTLDIRPDTWKYLTQNQSFQAWMDNSEWKDLSAQMQKMAGIDMRTVQARLGSHLLAVAYPEADPKREPTVVVAIEQTDPQAFHDAMTLVRSRSNDTQARYENYKGHDLLVENKTVEAADQGQQAVIAMLGQSLVLVSNVRWLKAQLDSPGQPPNLLSDPVFKPVYQALGKEPMMVWANSHALNQVFGTELLDLAKEFGPISAFQHDMGLYQSLGVGLGVDSQGLTIHSQFPIATGQLTGSQQRFLNKLTASPQPDVDSLLALMPEKPLFSAASGRMLLSFDSVALAGADKSEADWVKQMSESLKDFKAQTGLDLNQDLLGRSDGRTALSVFYLDRFPSYEKPPEFVAMLGVKEPASFLANLQQKLAFIPSVDSEDLAQPITLAKKPVETYKNVPIYALEHADQLDTDLPDGIKLSPCVAVVGQTVLLGSTREALRFTIDYSDKTRANLLTDTRFQQLRQRMNGQEALNLVYSDLGSWYRLADNFLHSDAWFKAFKPLLSQFEAFGADNRITSSGNTGHMLISARLGEVDFDKLYRNLEDADNAEKREAVRSNIRTAVNLVRHYQETHQGKLPASAAALIQTENELFDNPVSNSLGVVHKAGEEGSIMDYALWKSLEPSAAVGGLVLVENVDGKLIRLYGTDTEGHLLRIETENGGSAQTFMLEIPAK